MHAHHFFPCLLAVLVPFNAMAAAPRFRAADVDTKVEIGYGVTVADVNGDKRPDILLVDKNIVVWYENPSWTKHVMAEKLATGSRLHRRAGYRRGRQVRTGHWSRLESE